VNVGIFGGTFDPPHVGHLVVAQDAWSALALECVRFVPAAAPPHKTGAPLTPGPVRAELVAAAIGDDARFALERMELERPGPSYTVDTLRALRLRAPAERLVLLIGADQWAEFSTWREPDAILELARVVVLTREGQAVQPGDARAERLPVTRIDVSSTEIRRRVRRGEPIRYLVPERVERKIREHGLYGSPPVAAGVVPRV
jgi:nicotinate-nucleotide adenylyltransferase